jgi:hypothetical protein
MALDITGKIIQIMPAESGISKAGNNWTKQDFVIETQEMYPKKVAISTMNDKANLSRFSVGNLVTVHVNLESREYNGRWYTSVSAWKIEGNASQQQAPPAAQQNRPAAQTAQPSPTDTATDDLPF